MDILIDLINYLRQRKLQLTKGDTLATQLHKGIEKGRYSADREARAALFGDSAHQVRYYNGVKQKLRDILYHTILATAAKNKNYWEELHLAEKKILVAKQLALGGMIPSAIRIMEEAAATCRERHFTAAGQEAAFKLSTWYAVSGRRRKYHRYQKEHTELWRKLQLEQKAESYYVELFDRLRHHKGVNPETVELAGAYHRELAADMIDTFTYRTYAHYITILYHELANRGEAVIAACGSAQAFFESLPFDLPDQTHRLFRVRMIPALLQQGQHRDALEQLSGAMAYVREGSANWGGLQVYRAISGFHLQDLDVVRAAIGEIKARRKVSAQRREEVAVLDGYLAFMAPDDVPANRVATLMKWPYSGDKKGLNINVVIMQILLLLRYRKLPPIIDRMEALRTYSYRHLKKDPVRRRPYLFIQLLLLVARYSFDARKIDPAATELLAVLQSEPRHLQSIDVEIVPYDILWEEIRKIVAGFDW